MNTAFLDYLPTVLHRQPTREELSLAAEISMATFERRKAQGFTLEEILKMLDYFGLSRPRALISLGILDIEETMDAVGMDGALVDLTSTVALAQEVARRLSEDAGETPGDNGDNPTARFPVTKGRGAAVKRRGRSAIKATDKKEIRRGLLE